VRLRQRLTHGVAGVVGIEPRVIEQEAIRLVYGDAQHVERVKQHEPARTEADCKKSLRQVLYLR
jgi:hypothetical protein